LSDCRAYELVSPPDKGGSDVIQQTAKTHVASDGNGVTFSALGGFGNLQGTSFDSEYVSHRTGLPGTNGWSTHGTNPPGGAITLFATTTNNIPSFVDAFTPDLSAGLYLSWRPLTDAPNAAEVSNFYRIDHLGGDSETAQLMSDSVTPPPASWAVVFKQLVKPFLVGASSDLRHVVFESRLALTADAVPYQGFCTVFSLACPIQLYENADGIVRFVGRIPDAPDTSCDDVNGPACVTAPSSQAGISATGQFYSQRMVSHDGRRIFFQTPAGAGSGAIYMREDGVRTVQLAQDGELWAASTDGSRAFFITSEALLPEDTDSSPDVYMYDTDAPANAHLTLISRSSTANDGDASPVLGASADGHYVYFVSALQLVAGEPPAGTGLYVWHDGTLAYIGSLQDSGEAGLNGPRTTYIFAGTTSTSRVTPDGRHLLFMTTTDAGFRGRGGFGGYDQAGHPELYLYSADTGRLVCASCNPSGRAATADALLDVREGAGVSAKTSKLSYALSDDGRYVFFSTAEALVSDDTNGRPDAYEYDAADGSVHLLSSGTDPSPSYFIDASSDGQNAFFVTRERLVGWDTDGSYDLYDARVGGGFSEPVPAPPGCTSEGCLPQGSAAPTTSTPSSATYNGSGNTVTGSTGSSSPKPTTHRRCARNSVPRRIRGHVRCVRRPRKHSKHTRGARAGIRYERSGR
jgi:Tol biopolymer transport system component